MCGDREYMFQKLNAFPEEMGSERRGKLRHAVCLNAHLRVSWALLGSLSIREEIRVKAQMGPHHEHAGQAPDHDSVYPLHTAPWVCFTG